MTVVRFRGGAGLAGDELSGRREDLLMREYLFRMIRLFLLLTEEALGSET